MSPSRIGCKGWKVQGGRWTMHERLMISRFQFFILPSFLRSFPLSFPPSLLHSPSHLPSFPPSHLHSPSHLRSLPPSLISLLYSFPPSLLHSPPLLPAFPHSPLPSFHPSFPRIHGDCAMQVILVHRLRPQRKQHLHKQRLDKQRQ